eukprot:g14976.t1
MLELMQLVQSEGQPAEKRQEVDPNIRCWSTGKLYTEALLGVGISREKKNLGTAADRCLKEAFDGGLRQNTDKSTFEFFLPVWINEVEDENDAILEVFPRLINQMIVEMMRPDAPKSAAIATFEALCNFWRTFRWLVDTKAALRNKVAKRIIDFVKDESFRHKDPSIHFSFLILLQQNLVLLRCAFRFSKDRCPDLGALLVHFTVLQGYDSCPSREDFLTPYADENSLRWVMWWQRVNTPPQGAPVFQATQVSREILMFQMLVIDLVLSNIPETLQQMEATNCKLPDRLERLQSSWRERKTSVKDWSAYFRCINVEQKALKERLKLMDEPLLPAHRVPHDLLFRRLGPLVAKGLQLPDLWRLEVDVPQADALLQEKLRRPRPAPELQECGRRAPWTASWDRLPALVQKLCLAYWPDMLPASLFKLAADLLRYVTGGIEGAELVESNYCARDIFFVVLAESDIIVMGWMIDYNEDWLFATVFRLDGSVALRSTLFALPAALFSLLLMYMDEFVEDFRDDMGLANLASSQIWNASTVVLVFLLGFRARQDWEISGDVVELRVIDVMGLDSTTLHHLWECSEVHKFNRVEVCLHLLQTLITKALDDGVLKIPPPILSRVYQTISRGFVNLLNTIFAPILTFLAVFSMFALNFISIELENPFESKQRGKRLWSVREMAKVAHDEDEEDDTGDRTSIDGAQVGPQPQQVQLPAVPTSEPVPLNPEPKVEDLAPMLAKSMEEFNQSLKQWTSMLQSQVADVNKVYKALSVCGERLPRLMQAAEAENENAAASKPNGEAKKKGGRVAYCGQQPHLIRGSVRENILFGRPYVHQSYISAVRSCGLADLEEAEEARAPQVPRLSGPLPWLPLTRWSTMQL